MNVTLALQGIRCRHKAKAIVKWLEEIKKFAES